VLQLFFHVFVMAVVFFHPLVAQTPADLVRERADYLAWLRTAPNSPLAAIARQQVGTGLRLGPPDADIPLPGIGEHRIVAKGRALMLHRIVAKGHALMLATPLGTRPVSRGQAIRLGSYTLYLGGLAPGTTLTVFGPQERAAPPGYYAYDPSLVFSGPLLPPRKAGTVRVLAADGTETDASEAGSVVLAMGGLTRLRVLRIGSSGEESELEIFFRDGSNGRGTYPAGRFVSLIPLSDGRYRLDFNRARNPFCAYNAVYPCPAPWRGNVIPAPVSGGERYTGGGLKAPSIGSDTT
jgi:hypothetical protein